MQKRKAGPKRILLRMQKKRHERNKEATSAPPFALIMQYPSQTPERIDDIHIPTVGPVTPLTQFPVALLQLLRAGCQDPVCHTLGRLPVLLHPMRAVGKLIDLEFERLRY